MNLACQKNHVPDGVCGKFEHVEHKPVCDTKAEREGKREDGGRPGQSVKGEWRGRRRLAGWLSLHGNTVA